MILRRRTNEFQVSDGFVLPAALGLIIVISIIAAATFTIIETNLMVVNNSVRRQKALNIAEAGLNYYLWHLSHSPNDYKDGQTGTVAQDATLGYGPFEHDYTDDNGQNAGTYTLYIKPTGSGSTIARVRSIGKVANSDIIRTIDGYLGAPSFASYGVVSDSALWFGNTETASGPVHSNQGVRMDGASTADVTSANTTYIPSSSLGGNGSTARPGVWCSTSVTNPVDCNTRSKTDWRYPVPAVDFNVVNGNLCTIKKLAFEANSSTSAIANQANACSQTPTTRTSSYLPQRATNGSYNATRGYLIQLNPNGTYDLFNVNGETDTNTPYTSALTLSAQGTNISIPSSGVIFAEDNVWVRTNPTYSGRVTIASGRLATTTNTTITVADDIVYGSKNGSDAIGLVSEGSIAIAPYAPPVSGSFNFEVDAAMIAQSGTVNYPNVYKSNTNRCARGWGNANQRFTFYGSVATRQQWTWTWQRGSACADSVQVSPGQYISGVYNNDTQYDYNLLYAPPPSFPITSSFSILSWREVLTRP